MPQRCTVCSHPDRRVIDRLLVRNERANRRIAAQHGLTEAALRRHRESHLPAAMVTAQAAAAVTQGDELLAELEDLRARTEALLGKAEAAGDTKTALAAIRESRGNLELLARLLGELRDRPVFNILVTPEWQQIQTVLAKALATFPDARVRVAEALAALATEAQHAAGG